MTQLVEARKYSRNIIMHAAEHDQRTGQYLFNSLPEEIRVIVTDKVWDPFHREMSQYQIEEWLLDHIIFNENGAMVKLYAGKKILWERNF